MELKSRTLALGAALAASALGLAGGVGWATDPILPGTPRRKYRKCVKAKPTRRAYKGSALAKRRSRRGGSHAA
jgi:hypothetical protein